MEYIMNRLNNDLSIDKKDCFTFVFNSKYGNKTGTGANETGYGIDWSVIPDQPYLIEFSYVGQSGTIDFSKLAQVYVDLGCPLSTYSAVSSLGRTTTNTSTYLGTLKTMPVGTNYFLISEVVTNPQVYIQGRPINNTPIVRIYDNSSPIALFTPVGDYILTMRFIPA